MELIAHRPHLLVFDDFLSEAEIGHVIDIALDRDGLAARGVQTKHDSTGFSFEMPIAADPVLEGIRARVAEASKLVDRMAFSFRFRHYLEEESHPPHFDVFEIGGYHLSATAIMHLVDCEEGGETHFPEAQGGPVAVAPKRGRLILWYNLLPGGEPDRHALHEGRPIIRGTKMTITEFVYADPAEIPAPPTS